MHGVQWDGKDNAGNYTASGMYFLRLVLQSEAGKSIVVTRKLLFMK